MRDKLALHCWRGGLTHHNILSCMTNSSSHGFAACDLDRAGCVWLWLAMALVMHQGHSLLLVDLSNACLLPCRCAGHHLSSKQGKDATTSAHIHDDFALEISHVFQDGSVVGPCPDLVLQHVLLMHEHAIVVEVQLCTACVCLGCKLILLLLQQSHIMLGNFLVKVASRIWTGFRCCCSPPCLS